MTSRRNTIQKDLVRNTVYEMRRHVTANEVYEFIKEAYPTIGKGTVYRNLDILVEEEPQRGKLHGKRRLHPHYGV